MYEPTYYNIAVDKSTDISVSAGATVLTDAFKLGGVNDFALEYKATCTGDPDIKIELMQSSDGVNYYVPDNMVDIVTHLTDKNYHGKQIFPICVGFMKFRITEQTGIVADTVINMKLSLQTKLN